MFPIVESPFKSDVCNATIVSEFITKKAEAALIAASQELFDLLGSRCQDILLGYETDNEERKLIGCSEIRLAGQIDKDWVIEHHHAIWVPLVDSLRNAALSHFYEGMNDDVVLAMRLAIERKQAGISEPANSSWDEVVFGTEGE